jgi:hypothetical protein
MAGDARSEARTRREPGTDDAVSHDRGAAGSGGSVSLTVSIVIYGNDLRRLGPTLASLATAAIEVPGGAASVRLVLVDNGPYETARSAMLTGLIALWGGTTEVLSGHGNLGYGAGHNLAIARSGGAYHLVLNPDVELASDALAQALAFLDGQTGCGLLAPAVRDDVGALQFLCKRRPTVLDLLLRGFAPSWLRERFRRRLDRYEMRDLINERDIVWDPPVVSGCFMLFRTTVLRALGGFDPRYFLYFEDFDLSLRAAALARVAYVPAVRIVHHGGGAARKGFRHVWMFAASGAKYFSRHGWQWA